MLDSGSRCLSLLASLACLLAGCDSGGSAVASGGTKPQLAPDWAMRRDVQLASDVIADVRSADLDGDGLADLVQANSVARELLVSLGLSDGSFGPPQSLPCVGVPWRSEFGDFDGDGRTDLATVSFAGNGGAQSALQVFLQDQTPGTFRSPLTHPFLEDPDDLAVAPLDGSSLGAGVPDELFVPINREKRVARLRVSGGALVETGSLDSSVLGHPGAAFSVAVFDQLADGSLELAVAEAQIAGSELGRVLVYPRVGADFGDPRVIYEPVYWPTVDSVGDVDGDGIPDLAIAQVDNDEVLLVLGDDDDQPRVVPLSFGPGATSVLFPDLDGDGRGDGVAAAFEEAAIYVRMADGPLSWAAPVRYDAGFLPRALGLIRLPGDALPDLVSANLFTVGLFVNRGGGRLAGARGAVLSARGPEVVRTADLDGDGDLDACVLCTLDPALLVLENDGQGRFQEVRSYAIEPVDAQPVDLLLIDGDGDGLPDPVVTLANRDRVRVYHSPLAPRTAVLAGGDPFYSVAVGRQPRGLAAGQLDATAELELVVALGEEGAVEVLSFDPQQARYVSVGRAPVAGSPQSVRLADLDGDLDLDLLVTTGLLGMSPVPPDPAASLVVCEWDGSVFVQRGTYPLDTATRSLDVGDVDGDRDLDVLVGQSAQQQTELFLFQNQGQLAFASRRIDAGIAPNEVRVQDVDGDRRLDVLIPSVRGELRLLMGDGRGNFPTVLPARDGQFALLFGTLGSSYAEVDGDARGLPDLVYVSPNAPMLWVAPNESIDLGP